MTIAIECKEATVGDRVNIVDGVLYDFYTRTEATDFFKPLADEVATAAVKMLKDRKVGK